MINPTTHAVTEFPVPTAGSSPFGITTGPDGNLWFTENSANQIGRLTLASSGLTIIPNSSLPAITDRVTIDGTTQPGFAGSPIIELDGARGCGGRVNDFRVQVGGARCEGLVINRFSGITLRGGRIGGNSINLEASDNVVQGNFIGTDVSGTIAEPNTDAGILSNGPTTRSEE